MGKNYRIKAETGKYILEGKDVTFWLSDNFSKDWYEDSYHEATAGKDHHSTRREILFSTCFLESYIFEWARGLIQIEELDVYFPSKPPYRSLKDKWKNIPEELYKGGKISNVPSLDLSDLRQLITYRNGLVHAKSSRPVSDTQSDVTMGFPTKDHLRQVGPGWAIRIAHDLVDKLHTELGTPIPDYLHRP
jgi:hypothetical protein